MTEAVENIVRSAVQTDPSITSKMLGLALEALKGANLVHATVGGAPCEAEELPPVVKRHDAARFLKLKLNTVDHMARIGLLVKVYATGTERGVGYTRESVSAALNGNRRGKRHAKRS